MDESSKEDEVMKSNMLHVIKEAMSSGRELTETVE